MSDSNNNNTKNITLNIKIDPHHPESAQISSGIDPTVKDNYLIEEKVKFMDAHTRTLHYIPNHLIEKLNSICRQKGDKTEHMTRALTEYLKKFE